MDNEAIRGGFSPDKTKLLVSSNRSGIYNMYTVPTDGGEFNLAGLITSYIEKYSFY